MAVKPILFNSEMVQAILDGRKTETRRIVKEIPLQAPYYEDCDGKLFACDLYGEWHPAEKFCRIQPGDILWVRETWRPVEASSAGWCRIEYKAGGTEDFKKVIADLHYQEPWHPSIHMPKDVARIFLRVKSVRAERLRDGFFKGGTAILEVQKEGVDIGETCRTCLENYGCPCCIDADGDIDECRDPECGELDNTRDVFARLWDSTIKPADRYKYGWAANPWVWVIEFERVEKPEG